MHSMITQLGERTGGGDKGGFLQQDPRAQTKQPIRNCWFGFHRAARAACMPQLQVVVDNPPQVPKDQSFNAVAGVGIKWGFVILGYVISIEALRAMEDITPP